ncbi:hypothetical protein [Streptomyces sp. NPDC056290]|uniref:hypothetical protein n=1 Tax=Streptomyces sp. NPDC056290 TaxID=3345771 RepID=UPI0035DE53F7
MTAIGSTAAPGRPTAPRGAPGRFPTGTTGTTGATGTTGVTETTGLPAPGDPPDAGPSPSHPFGTTT